MNSITGDPEHDRLIEWLGDQGFQLVHTEHLRSFGDKLFVLERGGCTVRVSRDNGVWVSEISSFGRRWYDPEIWRAAIDGNTASFEVHEPGRMRILRERLEDIAKACRDDRLGATLKEIARARFDEMMDTHRPEKT